MPIPHLGEMRRLFADIPLTEMNTSMTINATAMWLLALYQVVAEEQNPDARADSRSRTSSPGPRRTTSSRSTSPAGTYVFPPEHSLRLISDVISYTVNEIPKWNPINICSYHLQEAGATPTQELAYALCTAIAVLDTVKDSGQVAEEDFEKVVGRISFFVNAGVRFVEETCKMRAFVRLWDEITRERYGVTDEKMRRFRYGVQVNSLGLTEAQPENNVQRIVLEMLGVTLSKNARARAVQLPAWNEALGLPRPWDQQWSLRLQQVLAFESDLLEYDDIFEGSKVIEAKVDQLVDDARAEMDRVQALGGAIAAVGYRKERGRWRHAEGRRVVQLGDVVDRGPDPLGRTRAHPGARRVGAGDFILGNHEINALGWFVGARTSTMHRRQFASTLRQIEEAPARWEKPRGVAPEPALKLERDGPPVHPRRMGARGGGRVTSEAPLRQELASCIDAMRPFAARWQARCVFRWWQGARRSRWSCCRQSVAALVTRVLQLTIVGSRSPQTECSGRASAAPARRWQSVRPVWRSSRRFPEGSSRSRARRPRRPT